MTGYDRIIRIDHGDTHQVKALKAHAQIRGLFVRHATGIFRPGDQIQYPALFCMPFEQFKFAIHKS
jgi:hypothetical protein